MPQGALVKSSQASFSELLELVGPGSGFDWVAEESFKNPMAAIAQLAARRSHNPKVVSSILTRCKTSAENNGPS